MESSSVEYLIIPAYRSASLTCQHVTSNFHGIHHLTLHHHVHDSDGNFIHVAGSVHVSKTNDSSYSVTMTCGRIWHLTYYYVLFVVVSMNDSCNDTKSSVSTIGLLNVFLIMVDVQKHRSSCLNGKVL